MNCESMLGCARCGAAVDARLGCVSVCEGCLGRYHAACWNAPCACGSESAIEVGRLEVSPVTLGSPSFVARRSRVPVLAAGVVAALGLLGTGMILANRPVVRSLEVEHAFLAEGSAEVAAPIAPSEDVGGWTPFFEDKAGLTALAVDWGSYRGTVYVGVHGKGVAYTQDHGKTWSTSPMAPGMPDATRLFSHGLLTASSPAGVSISKNLDGFVSPSSLLSLPNAVPFYDKTTSSGLFIGTPTAIFGTTNPYSDSEPESWLDCFVVAADGSTETPSAVAFDCNSEGTYGAGPGGVWSLSHPTGTLMPDSPRGSVAVAANEYGIWAGTPGAIFVLKHGESEWAPVSFPGGTLIELATYAGWRPTLWAVTDRGVFTSADGGSTWRAHRLSGIRWVALDVHTSNVAYALGSTTVYRTTTGGD